MHFFSQLILEYLRAEMSPINLETSHYLTNQLLVKLMTLTFSSFPTWKLDEWIEAKDCTFQSRCSLETLEGMHTLQLKPMAHTI